MAQMNRDAALVFEETLPVGMAGTHLLVVGIGTYDYLLDGAHQNEEAAEGMGQVPSAANSARTIATWFLDNFENAERPLASVALVLSEEEPALFSHPRCNGSDGPLPNGDTDVVRDAVVAWIARASVSRNSQIILYFVGHGVFAGNSVLLCRDFGRLTDARFDGSVNLEDFLTSLETTPPNFQLIVIDACRTPDRIADITMGRGSYGRALLSPRDPQERGGSVAAQSVHFATSRLTEAWSRADGVSLYCTALLQALSGGGMQPHLDWWISTSGLQVALDAYVTRLAAVGNVVQAPDRIRSGQFNITRPRNCEGFRVPVYVSCDPETVWTTKFRLQATSPAADEMLDHDPSGNSMSREWLIELPSDTYSFSVRFDGLGDYADVSKRMMVLPPEMPICLPMQRKDRP